MVAVLDFPSLYLAQNAVFFLIYGILCAATIFLAHQLLKKSKHLKSSGPNMPGMRFPFWSFYGVATFFPSHSTLKRISLPVNTYIQQVTSGFATMFCNEKIIKNKFAFKDLIFLTKAESVQEFLCSNVQTTKPFTEAIAPVFGKDGLFLSIGVKWKSRRKMLTPLFHRDILNGFMPVFDRESKILVDILKRKQHEKWIDIIQPVGLCTMDIMFETLLGVQIGAQNDKNPEFVGALVRATQTIVTRLVTPVYHFEMLFRLSALGRQFRKDVNFIRAFTEQVIKEKKEGIEMANTDQNFTDLKKSRRKDLLGLLLDLNNCSSESICTETEIRDEVISFFFAGQDTTAWGITWALYLIGLYPDVKRKIHDELDGIFAYDRDRPVRVDDLKEMHYLECVLKESQRLYPSAPYVMRYALEDFSLCGYAIKKGSLLAIDAYDLHRNSQVFPNPEVFDPDRFIPEKCAGRSPYAYIPFSAGVRSCLGRSFAMMEEKTVIANVLRYFSLKSLEHRDNICPSFEMVLRSPRPLKMKFTSR